MEITAIVLLIMVLVLGAVVMLTFFQFLATVRENHRLFQKISAEIAALAKKIDSLRPPSVTITPASAEPPAGEAAPKTGEP